MNLVPITERWLSKSDDDLLGDLFMATFNYLTEQGRNPGGGENADTIRSLPRELRVLYLITILEAEVFNGGFTQYLSNREAKNIDEAISDLKWLGAIKRAEIVAQIREMIVELRKEYPVLIAVEAVAELNEHERKLLNDCWNHFEEKYEPAFERLADEYYRVAEIEPLLAIWLERLRTKPDKLLIPAEMA